MDARGTICAHCVDAEAEEPCPTCRQAVCISCLLDRVPCRREHQVAGDRSPVARALATLHELGVAVAGDRLLASDVALWMVQGVVVAPVGEPRLGRPDVLVVTVLVRDGYSVEILRRSEARDVEEVHAAARALAVLTGTHVSYPGHETDNLH